MKLVQTVLRRPTSVFLIVFAVLLFGISSLFGMPMAYMPDMEMPMELVMITWAGTDADSIERLVTEPVEDACETLTDVNTITSTTYDNYMMVQIQYNYSADLDDAYMELKAAMDNLSNDLPDGCGDATILEISMTSQATMSISANAAGDESVQGYLEDTVVPALESISGVAQVELSGAQEEYLRIVLDEAKLNQYGLTISAVGSAIVAADFDMPVGSVTVGTQNIALSASGRLDIDSADLRELPIQTHSGQIIQLDDVTTFFNLYREGADSISRYNGQESILLEVTKSNSASAVTVCHAVEDMLEQYADGSVTFEVISSEADNIIDSLLEVVKTLAIGVVLTMLVLLIFFGDMKACLIVGCSMPLSVLLAVIALCQLGFAFDMMTGTSLVIAIGMIVDNSIVVLESCFRANERGLEFRDAALQGTKEVMMSVFAGTLTTVVVYIPLAMADGMSGQMAGPLSWTIALTMLSSLLCAVTIVPLIFSLVKPKAKSELPVNKVLAALRAFYRRVTPSLLRHPWRVVAAAVAILVFSIVLVTQMEFVLFPSDYDGSIEVTASFRAGTKLEVMDEKVRELEQLLLDDPYFEDVTVEISNDSATFMAHSVNHCPRSSEDAVEEYAKLCQNAVGMDVVVTAASTSDMGSMMETGNTVDITLVSDDLESLKTAAASVEGLMTQTPGVIHINNAFNQSRVQGKLVIDSQKAQSVGMTQVSAAVQISYMLNGFTAATLDYLDKEYDVVLEYPEGKYDDIAALMNQPITTASGAWITLGEIAEIEYGTTLPSISRQDGQFITTVSATATQDARSSASKAISKAFQNLSLPAGVEEGQSAMDKMADEETSQMGTTLAIAIFLVFLVMAIQFDSPRLSLMVMLCIPFSLAGSFGMVFLSTGVLSIVDLMGFLVLFGIVVNNGILLVDATNELRQTMPLGDALVQAGETRLRPILMTTLTTVISMIPMIFSASSGMAMMKGMGYIVIGGLVASTILTMFLMPPFYLLIRGETVDGTRRRGRKEVVR